MGNRCKMMTGGWLAMLGLAAAVPAWAQAPTGAASIPAPHPQLTRGWVETKLYFALGQVDGSQAADQQQRWQSFLDSEVSPLFPAGLSVEDVYGQWQDQANATVQHLRSKVLIIDYPDSAGNRAKIERIRERWKTKTGAHSVMRVTVPADVSF